MNQPCTKQYPPTTPDTHERFEFWASCSLFRRHHEIVVAQSSPSARYSQVSPTNLYKILISEILTSAIGGKMLAEASPYDFPLGCRMENTGSQHTYPRKWPVKISWQGPPSQSSPPAPTNDNGHANSIGTGTDH